MSRNHLRVSAQANNERHESNIVRDIMKDFMNNATDNYARSEATTEPMAVTPVTKAPVKKGRTTREIKMQIEIDDLRKELTDSMDIMDTQTERIAVQQEQIKATETEINDLRKQNTSGKDTMQWQAERIAEQDANIKGYYKGYERMQSEGNEERAKFKAEIEALKALLKRYI